MNNTSVTAGTPINRYDKYGDKRLAEFSSQKTQRYSEKYEILTFVRMTLWYPVIPNTSTVIPALSRDLEKYKIPAYA
ncbi:MAG: hypothetical protein ACOCUL_03185, partial [Bacteroidota bacterium]